MGTEKQDVMDMHLIETLLQPIEFDTLGCWADVYETACCIRYLGSNSLVGV